MLILKFVLILIVISALGDSIGIDTPQIEHETDDADAILDKMFVPAKKYQKPPHISQTLMDKILPPRYSKPQPPKYHYTEDQKMCPAEKCVPFHLCKTNTISDIDIRFNKDDTCHYLDVCCKDGGQDQSIEIIKPMQDSTYHHSVEKNIHKGCGHRYAEGIGPRILEEDGEAQYGEFPWMVAILNNEKKDGFVKNVFVCGGSLIHPHVVLSAAHCMHKKSMKHLRVRAGEWDTQTTNEIWPHQDRRVSKIILHPDYYKASLQNDVALLSVDEQFHLTGNVQTICLPPQFHEFDHKLYCVASGWGKDLFGREGTYSVILKKVDLHIVDHKKCESYLRKTRLGKYFDLHPSFICAGGEKGRDTCKGDGGSPLACPSQNYPSRYYQSGIVSWGIGCGEEHVPGVYVDVAKFRNWIDEHFDVLGYEKSYYILEH